MEIYSYYYGAAAGQGIGIRAQSRQLEGNPIGTVLRDLSSLHALETPGQGADKLYYLLAQDGCSILGKSFLQSPKESGYSRSAPCGIQYVVETVTDREKQEWSLRLGSLGTIGFPKPDSPVPPSMCEFPPEQDQGLPSLRSSPDLLAPLVDGVARAALSGRQDEVLLISMPKGKNSEFARGAMADALSCLPAQLRLKVSFLTGLPVEEGVTNSVAGFDNAVLRFRANVLFCPAPAFEELKSYRSFIGLNFEQPFRQAGTFANIAARANDPAALLERIERRLNGRGGWTIELLNEAAVKADRELADEAAQRAQREAQQRARQRVPNANQKNIRNYKTDGRPVPDRDDTRPLDIDVRRAPQPAGRNDPPVQTGQWNPEPPKKRTHLWVFDVIVLLAILALGFGGYWLYRNVFAKPPAEPTAQPVQQVLQTTSPPADSLPAQEDGQQAEPEQRDLPTKQPPAEEQPGQNDAAGAAAEPGAAQEAEPVITNTEAPAQTTEATAEPVPEPTAEPTPEPTAVPAEEQAPTATDVPVPVITPETGAESSAPEPEADSGETTGIINKELMNRYAATNKNDVFFREVPSRINIPYIDKLKTGTHVWVVRTITVKANGEDWAECYYKSKHGYIMLKYLDILSQEESEEYDQHTKNNTPVPESMYGT